MSDQPTGQPHAPVDGHTREPIGTSVTRDVRIRLDERHLLVSAALSLTNPTQDVAIALRTISHTSSPRSHVDASDNFSPTDENIAKAIQYRLGICDLFVEKAQYYLEKRADSYAWIGYVLYALSILIFMSGAYLAVTRMRQVDQLTFSLDSNPAPAATAPRQVATASATDRGTPISKEGLVPTSPAQAVASHTPGLSSWQLLLSRFIAAFTAYGFIVIAAVACTRGARACLDQRERLLTKRHSLRKGQLHVHLAGGEINLDDMNDAFDWNRTEDNAFMSMATDTKAPWGSALEQLSKAATELTKAAVELGRSKSGANPA